MVSLNDTTLLATQAVGLREPLNWWFPLESQKSECMKTATVKSYMAKPGELEKKWFLVDAEGKVVGRLASDIAMILMGKRHHLHPAHRLRRLRHRRQRREDRAFRQEVGPEGVHLDHRLSGPPQRDDRTRFEREPESILGRSESLTACHVYLWMSSASEAAPQTERGTYLATDAHR